MRSIYLDVSLLLGLDCRHGPAVTTMLSRTCSLVGPAVPSWSESYFMDTERQESWVPFNTLYSFVITQVQFFGNFRSIFSLFSCGSICIEICIMYAACNSRFSLPRWVLGTEILTFVDLHSVTNSLTCNFICSCFYLTDFCWTRYTFLITVFIMNSIPPSLGDIYEVKLIFAKLQSHLDVLVDSKKTQSSYIIWPLPDFPISPSVAFSLIRFVPAALACSGCRTCTSWLFFSVWNVFLPEIFAWPVPFLSPSSKVIFSGLSLSSIDHFIQHS